MGWVYQISPQRRISLPPDPATGLTPSTLNKPYGVHATISWVAERIQGKNGVDIAVETESNGRHLALPRGGQSPS